CGAQASISETGKGVDICLMARLGTGRPSRMGMKTYDSPSGCSGLSVAVKEERASCQPRSESSSTVTAHSVVALGEAGVTVDNTFVRSPVDRQLRWRVCR